MNKARKQIIAGNEISVIKKYKLGGYEQKVLIDGKSKANPIIIFLHGGPGSPIPFSEGCRGMFPAFTDNAIMVYWDQLGCGINNHPIDDSFRIGHFVSMTVDLIQEIKKEFPQNRIILFGVSWGSILAAKAAAKVGHLIDRVITYGQVLCNMSFNDEVYSALESSKLSSKEKTRLSKIKSKDNHSFNEATWIMKMIRKHTEGYQCKTGEKISLFPILMGLMTSPDYKLKDFKAVVINGYAKNKSLIEELISVDLQNEFKQISIPYIILQGSTDIVTSTKTIKDFLFQNQFAHITCKVIENCGHIPDKNGMEAIISECMKK